MFFYFLGMVNKNTLNCLKYNADKTHWLFYSGVRQNINNMTLQKIVTFLFIGLSIALSSCCFSAKENYLGNNLYLSEFDNLDRSILYQTEPCAGSGVELVPMTVTEMAYNDKWIFVKTGHNRTTSDSNYWVINNSYQEITDAETGKKNTIGPLDMGTFRRLINEKSIDLELQIIDERIQ